MPVFFIRDAIKFPDVIHSLKPDPTTNLQDPNRYWDFMANSPETTNMQLHLFNDEGIPRSYRHLRGSSVHAFKWINAHGNTTYVKYRWVPKAGIEGLSPDEVKEIQGEEFNHATRDLYEHIENGDYPEWDLFIQRLDPADLDSFYFDPLDATKDWPEKDFPYEHVGTMILNKNPENVFSETEQVGLTREFSFLAFKLRKIRCCKVEFSLTQIRNVTVLARTIYNCQLTVHLLKRTITLKMVSWQIRSSNQLAQ